MAEDSRRDHEFIEERGMGSHAQHIQVTKDSDFFSKPHNNWAESNNMGCGLMQGILDGPEFIPSKRKAQDIGDGPDQHRDKHGDGPGLQGTTPNSMYFHVENSYEIIEGSSINNLREDGEVKTYVGMEGLKHDSMYHHMGGSGSLNEGEYYDPIIFLNAGGYQEELIRRGPFGGVSINKKGIHQVNSVGNVVATKRFWIRNVNEDGTMKEYLKRIDDDIKKGLERIKGTMARGRGDGAECSLGENVNNGEGGRGESKEQNEKGREHMEEKHMEEIRTDMVELKGNNCKEREEKRLNNDEIQALLKEAMAGSMRDVFKDELQAWLGLKSQSLGEGKGVREEQQIQKNVSPEKEDGEVEWIGGQANITTYKGEEEGDAERMISPLKEIFEEEREATSKKERRTSTRQANKRLSKDYEMDTVARATKRKECMSEGNLAHDQTQIDTDAAQGLPEGEGTRPVRRRL